MLLYGRNQHNIVKQLSSLKKKKRKKEKTLPFCPSTAGVMGSSPGQQIQPATLRAVIEPLEIGSI